MKPRTYTEQQVRDWNEKHPVGSECVLIKDAGDSTLTNTRSPAWLLPWGGAVVSVEGKSGGWDIGRVLFREEGK
jgi:hypothetical protein